ncbi:hypothetical protein [Marinagarivorans algicola]|uniref:hypothetical protein n=1 Tax=Marinagarivorans algicola TaxID=1513270 RepID=UPI0006B59C35|nr:hypothetical protein [Marinagarivorans algicola]
MFKKLTIIISLALFIPALTQAASVKEIDSGKTSQYKFNGNISQDLSGSAYVNGTVFMAYDGGKNSEFPEIRYNSLGKISDPSPILGRQIIQRDIEGTTQIKNSVFVTSSLSQVNEDTSDYRVLSAFTVGDDGTVTNERYVYAREMLLNALETKFGNNDWLRRVRISFGKSGGLNVEGLSASPESEKALVFGLRSPLYDDNFGSPEFDGKLSLNTGKAILLEVSDPFSGDYSTKITTLDLKGEGIRGLEYIPKMKGYILISGSVEKKDHYALWFYSPKSEQLTSLTNDSAMFGKLCRPESVLNIPEKSSFLILSEESGNACQDSEITFVKYSY